MSLSREARAARFHQRGPWVLIGAAVLVLIVIEAVRHHVLSQEDLLFLVILFPTIILHEVSHGVMAYWCGDDTAKKAGRLSLNPLRHIDPLGTILLPILLIVTTGRAFGWAKPVPISINKLRHPRNQAVLVGLVGPATNIVLAFVSGLLLQFVTHGFVPSQNPEQWPLVDELLYLFSLTNIFIAVFNLIPIPPLDGSAVLERLLPHSALPSYYRLRSYSIIIVLFFVLLAPGALDALFVHANNYWDNFLNLHVLVSVPVGSNGVALGF